MTEQELEGQKALLLDSLRYSYDTFAWHGPNLMQALRGVALQQVCWRPPKEASTWNIRELTLHVGDVMQRSAAEIFGAPVLREVDRRAFPLVAMPTETEWNETLKFLQQAYATLEQSVQTMPASALTG